MFRRDLSMSDKVITLVALANIAYRLDSDFRLVYAYF